MDAHQEQFEKDFEAALKEKRENAEKAPPINNHNEQILKKANSNGVVPLASKDDLSQSVIKAKRSFVEFLKLVFAIIGAVFVLIKIFINGKI